MTPSCSLRGMIWMKTPSTTILWSISGAIGDEDLIKIHFHTNEPWKVLEYCASLGEIYDIVVEDMDRQSRGLKG